MTGLQYQTLMGLIEAGVLVPTCATHDGMPDYLIELIEEFDGDGCCPILVIAPEHIDFSGTTGGDVAFKVVDG